MKCNICGDPLSSGHPWKNHGIKLCDYFYKYLPKFSKLTGKLITFKTIEQYENADFEDLNERNTWLKSAGDEGKEYIIDLLTKRKLKKNWIYAPGQTQLRLSNIPSILYFEKQFKLSFQEICYKLGFKIKYKNDLKMINKIDWRLPINVIIDSREKVPIRFPDHINVSVSKLEYGDYIISEFKRLSIEKKTINDLCGTISMGYDRFRRELDRAKQDKGYIVILCDSKFSDFKSIEYLPHTKKIKATYDFLSKRLRDLHEEFDNFQLCFCEGRKHAAKVAEFILKIGKKIKNIDIQYLIDTKIL